MNLNLNRYSPAKLWALALGLLVACITWAFAPDTVNGRLWQPLTEAALLRPPEFLFPGLWRVLAYGSVRVLGLNGTLLLLDVLGPLALGYVAYRAVSGIHTVLALILRTEHCPWVFKRLLIPGLVTACVAVFVSASPIFPASWMLTPLLLSLVLLFTVFGLMRRFLISSRPLYGGVAIFLTGVMAGEGAFGWLVLIALLLSCFARLQIKTEEVQRFFLANPASYNVAKWVATVVFLGGFGLTLGANLWFFLRHGGVWSTAFANYSMMATAADVAIAFGLVIAPFLLTLALVPRATDTDRFLSYARGMSLIVCGITSIAFLAKPDIVFFSNEAAMVLLRYLATFTLTCVLISVVVEVYCRNHLTVFMTRYGGEVPEAENRADYRFPVFVRRYLYLSLVVTLVGLSIWIICRDGTRALSCEVERCARQLMVEATGLERLFTDGSLDELIELKAARAGARLDCVSFFSKNDDHSIAVRQRALEGENDLRAMALGGSVLLGRWIDVDSPRLARSAVQLGFELWRRKAERPLPELGGFLARPGGYACAELPEGVDLATIRQAAEEFAARADSEDLHKAYERCSDRRLKERFDALKWRVARILELRSHEADRKEDAEEGSRLKALARKLDGRNASLAQMRTFLGLLWEQSDLRLTPEEGLEIALKRANFRAAQPHAEAVLKSNPDDPGANFALGMFHYLEHNYLRAELHLQRALEVRPTEPAFLNNLAIVRMQLGKLTEALELSDRALKLKPDRDELLQTNEEIRRRMK